MMLLPFHQRGVDIPVANRIANYMVVQITPIGIANLGWRFYLIWMSFNAIFIPVRPTTFNSQIMFTDPRFQQVGLVSLS